jgi:hypothetical protein
MSLNPSGTLNRIFPPRFTEGEKRRQNKSGIDPKKDGAVREERTTK